jgi:hypothetical protein
MAMTLRLGLASAKFTSAYPSAQTLDRKSARTAAHSGTLEKLYPSHDPTATGAGAVAVVDDVVAGATDVARAVAFGVAGSAVVVTTEVGNTTVAAVLVVGGTVDEIPEVNRTVVTVDDEGALPALGFRFWLAAQPTSAIAVNAHTTLACFILAPCGHRSISIRISRTQPRSAMVGCGGH